nr:MAG TPA: hypothetical protein [Bacteriophage sp.]
MKTTEEEVSLYVKVGQIIFKTFTIGLLIMGGQKN